MWSAIFSVLDLVFGRSLWVHLWFLFSWIRLEGLGWAYLGLIVCGNLSLCGGDHQCMGSSNSCQGALMFHCMVYLLSMYVALALVWYLPNSSQCGRTSLTKSTFHISWGSSRFLVQVVLEIKKSTWSQNAQFDEKMTFHVEIFLNNEDIVKL